jgi:AcrR family transcriptional regulator
LAVHLSDRASLDAHRATTVRCTTGAAIPWRTMEESSTARPVGRPRRFDEGTERKLLLDAGMKVMRRNGFAEASLAEVLEVAGVSTRAFYRHFATKDALLIAMFDREAEVVAVRLRDAAAAAPSAPRAVQSWLDEYLDLFASPRRVARVRLMTSEAARGAVGYGEAMERMLDLHAEPLAEALARGAEDGTLTSSDPYVDARSVLAIVDIVGERVLAREWKLEDARTRAEVLLAGTGSPCLV